MPCLDDLGIGHALVGYDNPLQQMILPDPSGGVPQAVLRPFAVTHFPRQDWALVYWDDVAMIYVRRGPDNAALIAEHEWRHVYPEHAGYQIERIVAGRDPFEAVGQELARKLDEDPASRRARQLAAAVTGLKR